MVIRDYTQPSLCSQTALILPGLTLLQSDGICSAHVRLAAYQVAHERRPDMSHGMGVGFVVTYLAHHTHFPLEAVRPKQG